MFEMQIIAHYIHIQNVQNAAYTDTQTFILIKKLLGRKTLKVLSETKSCVFAMG